MNPKLRQTRPLACYILSGARAELGATESERRTAALRSAMINAGHMVRTARGSWQGKEEPSLVLYVPPGKANAAAVKSFVLAALVGYGQDAALYVSPDRIAYLVTGPGRPKRIGRLESSATLPANVPGWTFVPSLNTYYFTREA